MLSRWKAGDRHKGTTELHSKTCDWKRRAWFYGEQVKGGKRTDWFWGATVSAKTKLIQSIFKKKAQLSLSDT